MLSVAGLLNIDACKILLIEKYYFETFFFVIVHFGKLKILNIKLNNWQKEGGGQENDTI